MSKLKNWTTITESQYPWERDALDFVREQFPEHEPYRAWANFEFIAAAREAVPALLGEVRRLRKRLGDNPVTGEE